MKRKEKEKFTLFSNKIYALYYGVSLDLLFFIAIYTIFFNQVKGLEYSTIISLDIYASLAYIIMQIPTIYIIRKIGNTWSMRIGNIMLLIAELLFIFGSGFIFVLIGWIIYALAYQFKVADQLMLRNNLAKENKEHMFSKINAKGRVFYSILTCVIVLFAGMLYDIYAYLPLYLCLSVVIFDVIISFFIRDETEKENRLKRKAIFNEMPDVRLLEENSVQNSEKTEEFSSVVCESENIVENPNVFCEIEKTETTEEKSSLPVYLPEERAGIIQLAKRSIFILLIGLAFFGVMAVGYTNSALILQEIQLSATLITICIFFARLFRIFSNILYLKLRKMFKDKLSLVLSCQLVVSFLLISLSGLYVANFVAKVILITIGLCLLIFTRDPFQLCMQDKIFETFNAKERMIMISLNQTVYKVSILLFSLLATIILASNEVSVVVLIFIPFAFFAILVDVAYFTNKLRNKRKEIRLHDDVYEELRVFELQEYGFPVDENDEVVYDEHEKEIPKIPVAIETKEVPVIEPVLESAPEPLEERELTEEEQIEKEIEEVHQILDNMEEFDIPYEEPPHEELVIINSEKSYVAHVAQVINPETPEIFDNMNPSKETSETDENNDDNSKENNSDSLSDKEDSFVDDDINEV